MNYSLNNKVLKIDLEGRIDTIAAPQVENDICEIIAANEFTELILDCEGLNYISSTGLRVVLKVKKENDNMKLINVNKDIYDIFDVTGFAKIITIEKAFRKVSVDGCPVIGEGAKGIIYRLNEDTIIKVYKVANDETLAGISREKELATKAFVLGIPTAISYDVVKVDDKFGAIYELINSKSLSHYVANDKENLGKYVAVFANLLKEIHSTTVDDTIPSVIPYVNNLVDTVSSILSEDDLKKVRRLVDEVSSCKGLLHMDYHTNNVMFANDEATLIDMDTVSYGHPVFDLANICVSNDLFGIMPGMVENFLKMDLETARMFFQETLKVYFGDKYNQDNVNKVYLMGYIRLARHYLRRSCEENVLNEIRCKLHEYINKVDTLEF